MVLDMDTIQFESRQEIQDIITALETSKEKNETAKELIDKLEVMDMWW